MSQLANARREGLKLLGWGCALLVGGASFFYYLAGNPFHELVLIIYGEMAPGSIVDTWEEVGDGDDGGTRFLHGATYTFRLPGGREVTGSTGTDLGRLRSDLRDLDQPVGVEVEYYPRDPSISRIKGDGSQSLLEWILRKVVVGAFLLLILLSPGVTMISNSLRTLRSAQGRS